ncbi:MAG: Crp/Fnr family transcriptional regulator, partial [Burkholderiales bacterium]|nr:Crp/Fnr family transcriptional regulator [Burkholderiales bacterium]
AIRQLLEWHIVRKEQRERELLTMTPEQRYQAFLTSYPQLSSRIQLRDVAHYLGVTPEALSRIRKRLRV